MGLPGRLGSVGFDQPPPNTWPLYRGPGSRGGWVVEVGV